MGAPVWALLGTRRLATGCRVTGLSVAWAARSRTKPGRDDGESWTLHAGPGWSRDMLERRPLGEPCVWDPALCLGLCGSWCLGPRVEAAYLSGTALAAALVNGRSPL